MHLLKIADEQLDMRKLRLGESGDIDGVRPFQSEQFVAGDIEEFRDADEHFDRRLDIVVFPVAYALFGYTERLRQCDLRYASHGA